MPERKSSRTRKVVSYSNYDGISDDDDFSSRTPPPTNAAKKTKRKPPTKRNDDEFDADLKRALAASTQDAVQLTVTAEVNKENTPRSPLLSASSDAKTAVRAATSIPIDDVIQSAPSPDHTPTIHTHPEPRSNEPRSNDRQLPLDDNSTDSEFNVQDEESDESDEYNPSDSDEDFGASKKRMKAAKKVDNKPQKKAKNVPKPKDSKVARTKAKPLAAASPKLTAKIVKSTAKATSRSVGSTKPSSRPLMSPTAGTRPLMSPGGLGVRRSWNPPGSAKSTPSPQHSGVLHSRSPASVPRIGLSKLAKVKPLHSTVKS